MAAWLPICAKKKNPSLLSLPQTAVPTTRKRNESQQRKSYLSCNFQAKLPINSIEKDRIKSEDSICSRNALKNAFKRMQL